MAPEFIIQNRQRLLNLKDLDILEMAEKIGSEVCRNLTENRCEWLKPSQIKRIDSQGDFNLVFVSDRKIKELNRQWRGKNSATDVLSFPLDLEPLTVEDRFEVGEIVISVDRAQAQAEEYGHSLKREIGFLITHGMLHILGFDHETPEEEKDMFSRQKNILARCGIKRN